MASGDNAKGGRGPDKSDNLLSKFDTMFQFFSKYHSRLDKNRRYYARDFATDVDPNGTFDFVFIPPSARRAIDEPADHILYVPSIKIPVRPSEDQPTMHEEIAEKKRKFANVWWQNVTELFNPLGDGRKALLNEGRICVKQTLRWDLLPDAPERKSKETDKAFRTRKARFRRAMKKLGHFEFLWNVELLDNKTVFEDPTNHRNPAYVYISYEILTEEAKRLFPKGGGEWRKGDDFQPVQYLEYWSRPKFNFDGNFEPGDHIQWIERERVTAGKSPYMYVPVAIEDAGYGMNSRTTKIEDKYVGISEHAQQAFVAQARQMTSWENVTEITAFPPVITRNMDPTRTVTVGPRETIPLAGAKDDPNAEDIEFMQWPGLPLEVMQLAQLTEKMVDDVTKMNIISGQPISGVETATEADQQIRNASAKLGGPVAALERLAAKMTMWALMDVDNAIESQVTVYGTGAHGSDDGEVTVGPKDINGFYRLSVELTTTDEDAVSLNKARFWMDAYARVPFLSAFTAMVRGDITDEPMMEMIQRAAEDSFLSPEWTMIRNLTGAQSFGEFAQMIRSVMEGGGEGELGEATPATTSEPASPGGGRLDTFTNALQDRDITEGASELRA